MSVRDELIEIIDGHVREIFTVDAIADAILARFPYMSADRSLYEYADSLRTQLDAANATLGKGDQHYMEPGTAHERIESLAAFVAQSPGAESFTLKPDLVRELLYRHPTTLEDHA